MEAFDPLALLEADYAAVLAQTRPSKRGGGDAYNAQPHDDAREVSESEAPRGGASNNGSNDESDEGEEDGDANAMYSLLPSSPGGGALGGFDSDGEEEEDAVAKEDQAHGKETDRAPAQEAPPMAADKRQAIIQAMQKLQLQAPAWAAANRVSDEQLVAMVQRQLKSKE